MDPIHHEPHLPLNLSSLQVFPADSTNHWRLAVDDRTLPPHPISTPHR
jgi:hypothetical protein